MLRIRISVYSDKGNIETVWDEESNPHLATSGWGYQTADEEVLVNAIDSIVKQLEKSYPIEEVTK